MTEPLEGAKVCHIESVPELTSHFGVPTVLAQKKDLDYIGRARPRFHCPRAISRDVYC